MNRYVLVSLLETIVLANVVQVVTSDDNGTSHFVLDYDAGQNATSDGHVAGERALFVNVGTIASLEFK